MPLFLSPRSGPIEGSLGVCTKCGKQNMRVVYFTDFLLERECGACKERHRTTPPSLNKKLIYLDQWTISEMANGLDPVLRQRKAGRIDPFWRELYHQLERLTKLHVVVCPESPLHYRESVVTPYLGILRRLYEHLAVGVGFHEPLAIHATQLLNAFNRVVRGRDSAEDLSYHRRHALHGTINEWSDDVRINVRLAIRKGESAAERTSNATADEHLGSDSDNWRQQPGRSFAEWHSYHQRDLTNVVLHCFEAGTFGIYTTTCYSMVQALIRDGAPRKEAIERVRAFLQSEDAASVPFSDISALLFAGISKKIADGGQQKGADHGHHNDIYAIAAFLPYVDAICVDNYFAELLGKRDIAQRMTKFPAKVFAPNERQAFMEYLQGLEADAALDLRDTVLAVYGSNWLKPYDTILEDQRGREQSPKRP